MKKDLEACLWGPKYSKGLTLYLQICRQGKSPALPSASYILETNLTNRVDKAALSAQSAPSPKPTALVRRGKPYDDLTFHSGKSAEGVRCADDCSVNSLPTTMDQGKKQMSIAHYPGFCQLISSRFVRFGDAELII